MGAVRLIIYGKAFTGMYGPICEKIREMGRPLSQIDRADTFPGNHSLGTVIEQTIRTSSGSGFVPKPSRDRNVRRRGGLPCVRGGYG